MTDRSADAAAAANPSFLEIPFNPLVDVDGHGRTTQFRMLSVCNTLERVCDMLCMLDELEFRDEFSSSTATGVHWSLRSCIDALRLCDKRISSELRKEIATHG